jgi:endonuclease/exonuclease/phosphatase family metal-dependent hydrolase
MFLLLLLAAAPFAGQARPITCITYNIRYDTPLDGRNAWPFRRERLLAQVRAEAPELIGIQEGLHRQVEQLQEAFPAHAMVGVARDDGAQDGEYSALFYLRERFEELRSGTFWLSATPEQPSRGWDAALNRICTYALLRDVITGRELWVFNTHFDHAGAEARLGSARLLVERIGEWVAPDQACILMGDFNSGPDEAPMQVLGAVLQDSRLVSRTPPTGPEGTFNGFKRDRQYSRRIDHVLVDRDLDVLRYAVPVDRRRGRYPSDHFPVVVTVQYR